jgi:tRNA(fMet)-specific endonuclease VapC
LIYLLDTNVCVRYLNDRSPAIKRRLEGTDPGSIALCSVVKGELLFGAVKSQVPVTTMSRLMQFMSAFESYPFDDRCAEVYARIRADLEKRGLPIGPNDTLIAATAIARQATVVTANTREFARIDGLRWEDWEDVGN